MLGRSTVASFPGVSVEVVPAHPSSDGSPIPSHSPYESTVPEIAQRVSRAAVHQSATTSVYAVPVRRANIALLTPKPSVWERATRHPFIRDGAASLAGSVRPSGPLVVTNCLIVIGSRCTTAFVRSYTKCVVSMTTITCPNGHLLSLRVALNSHIEAHMVARKAIQARYGLPWDLFYW